MTEEERIPLKEPIFKELQAEDPDVAPTEVESMCVNCGENVSHLSYLPTIGVLKRQIPEDII